MILSQTAEYAVQAVVQLARRWGDPPRSAEEIGEELAVPRNYLSKLLHELGRAGIVQSSRGRRGGFQLARDPGEISLAEVVSVFDDVEDRRRCLLGRPQCRDDQACEAHERWSAVIAALMGFLDSTTIAELAASPSDTAAESAGPEAVEDQ